MEDGGEGGRNFLCRRLRHGVAVNRMGSYNRLRIADILNLDSSKSLAEIA